MHHARPRRAGTSATPPPDDAALAQLFQRIYRREDAERDYVSTKTASLLAHSLGSQNGATARTNRDAFAVTTKHALAHEVREVERILHQNNNSSRLVNEEDCGPLNFNEAIDCKIPALQDLEKLMNELYEVCDRGASDSREEEIEDELSVQEREYANALQQAVVVTLTYATLAKHATTSRNDNKADLQDPLPMGEVRVWLLEMVVRPSALSRQLAFTLFLNLSVNVTTIVLATSSAATVRRQADQVATRLFHVLVDMLSKAVVVASSSVKEPTRISRSRSSRDHQWVAQAVGCLLLFVKQINGGGERFRADRLRAFDPQILRFFLKESSQIERNGKAGGNLENQLLELLVATMYAQEGDIVSLLTPSTKTQHQSPVRMALSLTALEHFGGLDLLLFHYYDTPSLHTRRLLFMVFFDVTCHQQRLKNNSSSEQQDDDELWRLVQSWDLAVHLAATPGLFTASSSTRVIKKLYTSAASPELPHQLSEKYVQHFVNQLRLLVRDLVALWYQILSFS